MCSFLRYNRIRIMGTSNTGFLNNELSKKTIILGLRLWVVIGIGVGAFIVLILCCLSIWLTSRRKSRRMPEKYPSRAMIPKVSKEIQEVRVDAMQSSHRHHNGTTNAKDDMEKAMVVHMGYGQRANHIYDTERVNNARAANRKHSTPGDEIVGRAQHRQHPRAGAIPAEERREICVEVGKDHRIINPLRSLLHMEVVKLAPLKHYLLLYRKSLIWVGAIGTL